MKTTQKHLCTIVAAALLTLSACTTTRTEFDIT